MPVCAFELPAPAGEGAAGPALAGPTRGRPERLPAVDDRAAVGIVLVGLPGDGARLTHAGLAEVADSGGERRLQGRPLRRGELERVVAELPQGLQLALLLVSRDVLAGGHARRRELGLHRVELADGTDSGQGDLLDAVDTRTLVVDVGRPVVGDLLLQRDAAVVAFDRGEPAVHRHDTLA